jgi:anti-anti-sigma regulatory factor
MLQRLLEIQTTGADPLTLRRSRSLARLLILLLGISILLVLIDPLLTGTFVGAGVNAIAIILDLTAYFLNRRGRLTAAVSILLAQFAVLPIIAAVFIRAPLPSIFFPCLIIVIAAAFGRPSAPLIWAAVSSAIPLIINLILYRSPIPVPGPIVFPDGTNAPPILAVEVLMIILYWMLAGISSLANRQLYQTIDESLAATQAAIEAQQSLASQQADLAARNEELIQARQDLEALVSELTVPVVPVADGIGLLPLVGSLDAGRAARIEQDALKIVAEQRLHALVIDLSGASGLRTASVERLVRLCAALQLLGVAPVLAGLGPQSALLLSSIDVALPRTVATVQDALALLQTTTERRVA